MSQNDMPVFCDVSTEDQIEALRDHFKAKGAKLNVQISLENINENLSDLIKNIESVLVLSNTANETELEQLETVLNSLLSLIIISPDENSKLVASFSDAILKSQSSHKNFQHRFGLVKLRVLSNLFHGLISSSKNRYAVFVYLTKCSLTERTLEYLPTNLDQIKKFLQTWSATLEETQTLYRLLFETLSQMNESQKALKVLHELLGTYTKETASKAREDAHKCIVYCINDPSIFIFDSLLVLEPIKFLEGEVIHNLFTIFVSGKLSQYLEFYNAHKNFISQNGMDHERNQSKMRILSLMSLAENSKELPFELLQKQLQIEAKDIESFVIDAIRTKCISCKIDHLAKTVTVMNVSYRSFTKQHWQVLKDRLDKWKESLALIDQNLTNLLSQPQLVAHMA